MSASTLVSDQFAVARMSLTGREQPDQQLAQCGHD